eukprot:4850031-Prymnesium_polylepis.1
MEEKKTAEAPAWQPAVRWVGVEVAIVLLAGTRGEASLPPDQYRLVSWLYRLVSTSIDFQFYAFGAL